MTTQTMLLAGVGLLLGPHAASAAIGNALSAAVCRTHGVFPYCWVPSWQGQSHNWTAFWTTHGHEVVRAAPRHHAAAVDAAVHLRCGDVIMHTHKAYPFACKRCLQAALAWLAPAEHVIMVVGGHHKAQDRDEERSRCALAISHYLAVFRDHGFDVTIRHSRESWPDWWFLHHAHKVLALVPSSFSFTAKAHDLAGLRIIGGYDDLPVWQLCRNTSGFRVC